jgi:hypothetical protein
MSENQASVSMIAEGKDYELLGSPDKASFVLRSKADLFTAHLQGEDATRFQADYEAVQRQFPEWKPDQTLAQLWDQGGYSWLAVQDGE